VARSKPEEIYPPCYPPRARWYRGLYVPWLEFRRTLYLERISLPGGVSASKCLLGLLVPGFSFIVLERRILGRMILAGYCLAGLGFMAAFGYRVGSVALGLMIAAHATSIVYLEGRWLAGSEFRTRIGLAILTLIALWGLAYLPLIHLVERQLCMPMRIGDNVIIVQRGVSADSIRRGDWIAWRIQEENAPGVFVQSGLSIDAVLAVAGDRVEFTKEALLVNGKPLPRAPHMPITGSFVVVEKTWFIWPQLGTNGRADGGEAAVSSAMQRLATVSEKQLVGKPFKRWFGRWQIL